MFKYGLNFWNPVTGHEIFAYFWAGNAWDAEDMGEIYILDGYMKGSVHYIEQYNDSYYTVPVEKLCSNKV